MMASPSQPIGTFTFSLGCGDAGREAPAQGFFELEQVRGVDEDLHGILLRVRMVYSVSVQ
jgi:hypothetical protein